MGTAEWAGVIPNVVVTAVDGIAGFTTYALTVTLPDTARNMFSIFSDEANAMRFPAALQDVSAAGADIGGVSPVFWDAFPDSQYDSWLSIGLADGLTGGEISNLGVDFSAWDSQRGLEVADGAIFWMVPDNGPRRSEGDVTIGQVTLPTGTAFTATANARGRGSDSAVDADGVVVGDWLASALVWQHGKLGTIGNGGCGVLSTCINNPGSFECSPCPPGYEGEPPDTDCVDVNECEADEPPCHELKDCINLPGNYSCGQ